VPIDATRAGPTRYNPGVSSTPPLCPTCDQPASEALGGPEHDWECRNEACPEFGQPVEGDERPPEREHPRP
jgi:hypothetical protein